MVKNIVIAVGMLFIGSVAVSQSTNFGYKQIEPTTDCKSVIQFDAISPTSTSTYSWDFGDGNNAVGSSVSHDYALDSTFTVTLTTDGNTANAVVKKIQVLPFNFFVAVHDSSVYGNNAYAYKIGSPFFTTNVAGFTFNWAINDGVGNVVDPANTHFSFDYIFSKAGVYDITFTLTSPNGCSGLITSKLAVVDTIVVPNVFTPDGDGVNDFWTVKSNGVENLSVKIFSRHAAPAILVVYHFTFRCYIGLLALRSRRSNASVHCG